MRHGTLTAYVTRGCRCEPCRRRACRYNKQLRIDALAGRPRLVDPTPARDHVAALLAGGMSFRAISLAAGWRSRNALDSALASRRIRPATLARILAVAPDADTRGDAYVDGTGTRRRLQALAAVGWPSRALAQQLGHADHSTVLDITRGATTTVRKRTADRVRGLYDDLWDTPGPSPRTAARAARLGWLPPLALDDDRIDDPAYTPDKAAVRRRQERSGVAKADVLELLELGETVDAIAQRFGVTPAAVDRARYGRTA